ncbi:TniQ family protein [Roseibium sp. SCP14]|uniref:TniQ family protein n=1 Tax=Roseibium sp. SCP14 TaxID=3141375 RepID=UPI0033373AB9
MTLDAFFVPTCYSDETVLSFCSRIAAMHTCSLQELCKYKRELDYVGIRDGDPKAIGKLTKYVGLKGERFPGVITNHIVDHMFEINGQRFTRASLRRAQVRVCPHCLQEDLKNENDHIAARPYGRVSWTIGSIRTCSKHETALVTAAKDDHPQRVHDFTLLVRPFLKDIDQHVASALHRTPSDLETYLDKRIKGESPNIWLCNLPVYAAARACEIIGATKIHGASVKTESLSEDQWYEAGHIGFEFAAKGAVGIQTYLDQMQLIFTQSRINWGARQIYGRLYEWLAHETDDSAYDELRDIIIEHALKTLPLGPEDEIFGKRPPNRILHSIHSAYLETGAHPKRLKKVLHAVGLINVDQLRQSDDRIVFRADEAKFYLDRIEESMSLNQVRAYINAPRPVERGLLEAGILKPWLQGGTEVFKDHAFAKRDVDDFLATLTAEAEPIASEETNLVPILRAAKLANCTTPEVVKLILKGNLRTIRLDPEETGFLSLLVDPSEVKPLVRREDHGGYSLREVERKLKTSTRVVKALIEHGYLQAETAVNPINRCPQTIVKRDVLHSFMVKFETANSLSRRTGNHLQTLMRRLKGLGINPAFPTDQVPATIFALDQVASADPELVPEP